MIRLRETRGIALPLAIFALVIIGALVAGAFFIGFQEQRVGRNTIKTQQAFAAAEAGAQAQVAAWVPANMNAMAIGSTAVFAGTLTGSNAWYRGDVLRLNRLLYLVRSEGFSSDSTARQHIGMLLRLRPVEFDMQAALTTQGSVKLGGSSYLDGNDHIPTGWSGCDSLPALAGIRTSDTTDITVSGGSLTNYVNGSPVLQQDTTITSASLTTFGDITFSELASMATMIIGSGPYQNLAPSLNADGTCNTTDPNNWGDPYTTGPCSTYFPYIYSPGSTTISGGYGQGVLVVNGDLTVSGGMEFFGPVIVNGSVSSTGTGGHFNGGLIAANVNFDSQQLLGNAVVTYSSCALLRALTYSAPGAPIQERSWVDLY